MSAQRTILTPKVAVIGAGPSGLTAAAELAKDLGNEVLVIEREAHAGGIPRHSDHTGYGLRDLRRVMTGPNYARRLEARATEAGASVLTRATVTGWSHTDPQRLELDVTTPQGLLRVVPDAVVLATGARERPRTARRIPGDRPAGVLTTGQLQNMVHLYHQPVGRRAVVVGSELVSWSAVMTLREAGCETVAMTTEQGHQEAYLGFWAAGRVGLGVAPMLRARVTRIIGKPRVKGVEIERLDTGERRVISCDTVVFTGDWVPDHELARQAGIVMDGGTNGPAVDQQLRTSVPGVFGIGNVVHPVDTADVAALDGRHVAPHVLARLRNPLTPTVREIGGAAIVADGPFSWVAPNRLSPDGGAASRGRLLLWSNEFVRFPLVSITQDGRTLAQRRMPWPAAPGRVFRIPWAMLSAADPEGGDIHVGVRH